MFNLTISASVLQKLQTKHSVSKDEVVQCFLNKEGKLLQDTREQHKSEPPTLWFIAKTNKGRLLKIVYIPTAPKYVLRSAFPPNEKELDIYRRIGGGNF